MCNGQDLGTVVFSSQEPLFKQDPLGTEDNKQLFIPVTSEEPPLTSQDSDVPYTCQKNKCNLSQHLEWKKIQQPQKTIIKSIRNAFQT